MFITFLKANFYQVFTAFADVMKNDVSVRSNHRKNVRRYTDLLLTSYQCVTS